MPNIDHTPHIDWKEFETLAPGIPAALRALSMAIDEGGLDKSLSELVKLRASQINGCAFCLQFHLNAARKLDIAPAKLDLLAAWHEAGVYTERERAALAWTEALTRMPQQAIAPDCFAALELAFSRQEIVLLTGAIAAIQAWNRIAGALAFTPPVPAGAR
jgi:AhpD family alkylhydroperoxidase